MKLLLKVVPGASRNEIAGWLGDRLKVRVTAPPESGKANAAVKQLLASILKVSDSDIEITTGNRSPLKSVAINGLTKDVILQRLNI